MRMMSKKRRSFAHLEREFEDKIVDWFQEQELLYRLDADGYSNKTKKDIVWAEGAQLLEIEEEHLRHFIRDMRTLFSKLIKPGKSDAWKTNLTERRQWVLRRFGFLRNHIQHRRTGFSRRKANEATVEEEDGEEDEELEEEIVVAAVDSTSDIESQEKEPEKSDTINLLTESANESNLHTMTKTATPTQRQVPKRPVELLSTTQCSTRRLPLDQPIPKKAKVVRKNASANKSRPQTDSLSAIPTHHIAAMEEDEEKNIIKQIREMVKSDDQKKGMDKQMKSFLEMMRTSMVSLHPKRRHKAQRKLLNLMFDELDQQEKEDAQQSVSPWCASSATSVKHPPHNSFGQQVSERQTMGSITPSMHIPSTTYSSSMPSSSVLTPIPNISIVPTQSMTAQSMPRPRMPQITSQFGVRQLYYGQHKGTFTSPTPSSQQTQQPHLFNKALPQEDHKDHLK